MSRQLVLAYDLGTTGDKATLFDAQGRAAASAFAGYETAYPRPNWAEQTWRTGSRQYVRLTSAGG